MSLDAAVATVQELQKKLKAEQSVVAEFRKPTVFAPKSLDFVESLRFQRQSSGLLLLFLLLLDYNLGSERDFAALQHLLKH